MNHTQHPTWDDTICALFTEPYWIEEEKRTKVAKDWYGCMEGYAIKLNAYDNVKEWAVTIYNHLHSRNMPLTTDKTQLWPDEALEVFRLWINEGYRKDQTQEPEYKEIIPPPKPRPLPLRIRKNITELTEEELNTYRMKLDELGIGNAEPTSPWQELAYVHTNWCLHYQEAFLMWHRAFLLYFEQLVDFPIPYWNWTSPHATEDGHPEAGLPQAFKDLTYIHPQTGEERPNPLRFAAAKDGKSKACVMPHLNVAEQDCKYVHRDPILYTQGDDDREKRLQKLALISTYQRQIVNALLWPRFSTPEGDPGYPWANIPTFPAPDEDYPHRCDFDGLYEQPHDNVHGWVGPDMADNAYTAFDPVFWSHHSNLDRIFETWKREHPTSPYTATFPIRPFLGANAGTLDLADPRDYIYTTIGDMVKDCRTLGYEYLPPKGDDISRTLYQSWPKHLYILFPGVQCTQDTYAINIFLNQESPTPQDINLNNAHYVGEITRLGMGIEDDKGRCVKQGVTRVIDASYTAQALKLPPDSDVTIRLIVKDVTKNEILSPEEYKKLPGFDPIYRWGNAMPPKQNPTDEEDNETACHV